MGRGWTWWLWPFLTLFAAGAAPDGRARRPLESAADVGEPKIIQEAEAESLLRLQDGTLFLAGTKTSFISKDQGATWMRQRPLSGHIIQRRDGSFYVLDEKTRPGSTGRTYVGRCLRFRTVQEIETLSQTDWSEIPVRVERWTPLTGDDGHTDVPSLNITGPILELSDGSLIVASYGNFAGDTVPMEGFVPDKGQKWFKYRTYLLASRDGGASWNYLSTVAYDGETGQESFCEPGIVELEDGELVAVMRTGRFAPMYQARSRDGGRTWSRPQSLHTLGLAPQLTLLPGGTLACSFGWRPTKNQVVGGGRPAELALRDYNQRYRNDVGLEDPSAAAGDYIMFSFDRGQTWSRPRQIARALTVGYTRVVGIRRNACLVLSQRLVIPGESAQSVQLKWASDWAKWVYKSRRVVEARVVSIKGKDSAQ